MTLQADDSQYEPYFGQLEPDEAGIARPTRTRCRSHTRRLQALYVEIRPGDVPLGEDGEFPRATDVGEVVREQVGPRAVLPRLDGPVTIAERAAPIPADELVDTVTRSLASPVSIRSTTSRTST